MSPRHRAKGCKINFLGKLDKQGGRSKPGNPKIVHQELANPFRMQKDTARRNECCDGLLFPPEQSLMPKTISSPVGSASTF